MKVQVTLTGEASDVLEKLFNLPDDQKDDILKRLSKIDNDECLLITISREFFRLFGKNDKVTVDAEVNKI